MRLLHTSDWHLGRSFHGVDLLDAQAAAIDALVETTRRERVDAVLVAGDLYDRALPPVGAVELWGEALERLTDAGAAVVAISGNHDSARRLGGGARLLERARVHVRTDVGAAARPVLLGDDHGPVAVYPVPYLEPEVVRPLLESTGGEPPGDERPGDELARDQPAGGQPARGQPAGDPPAGPAPPRSHAGVLRAVLDRCRADLAARGPVRSVAVAHAFVAGGAGCDSERALTVGGAGDVPVSAFAGFDYVALGHLHRRQTLGAGRLRYAGSPVPYSFSEAGQDKGGWLVELGPAGVAAVEPVETPVRRRLVRLRGRLDELLTGPAHHHAEDAFVSATLTDPACPAGAMARLQRRFPHAVELAWVPEGGVADLGDSYATRVRQRDDLSVVAAFVHHVRNTPPTPAERDLLGDVLASAGRERVEV